MKQSKLRKRRVWRFAVMYFTLFVVFLALAIAPVLGGSKVSIKGLQEAIGGKQKDSMINLLFQPNNRTSQWYNDTGPTLTKILESESSVMSRAGSTETGTDDGGSAETTSDSSNNRRRSVKLL